MTPQPSTAQSAFDVYMWPSSARRVVGTCVAINMLDGLDVLVLSYVAPALSKEWGLSGSALGSVFSVGLFGMMLGSVVLGSLADRFGRRLIILAALILAAAAMTDSAFAETLPQLLLVRFIAGLGIGTLIPTVSVLAAQHAPAGKAGQAIAAVQSGYPLGSIIAGLATAPLIQVIGWRGCLAGAGLVTLLLVPVAMRFAHDKEYGKEYDKEGARQDAERRGIAQLYKPETLIQTVILWCAIFLTFGVLYFLISWIPKLAVDAGLPQTQAIIAATVYNIGAFSGTVTLPRFKGRYRTAQVVAVFLSAGAIFLLIYGLASLAILPLLAVAFLLGFTVQGGFNGFYGLASEIYAESVRATGMGWAAGVGRAGAVLGPLAAGWILDMHADMWVLFVAFATPLGCAAILSVFLGRAQYRGTAEKA